MLFTAAIASLIAFAFASHNFPTGKEFKATADKSVLDNVSALKKQILARHAEVAAIAEADEKALAKIQADLDLIVGVNAIAIAVKKEFAFVEAALFTLEENGDVPKRSEEYSEKIEEAVGKEDKSRDTPTSRFPYIRWVEREKDLNAADFANAVKARRKEMTDAIVKAETCNEKGKGSGKDPIEEIVAIIREVKSVGTPIVKEAKWGTVKYGVTIVVILVIVAVVGISGYRLVSRKPSF